MNELNKTKSKVLNIIEKMMDGYHSLLENDENRILHVILSESNQALEFVCLLEDEFNIEFDDDEVDIYFFSSVDYISELINKHLQA